MSAWLEHKETCKYCGTVKIKNKFTYAYDGHPEQKIIREYCWECKQSFIGTRQKVIRYGDIPKSGFSYNYRENRNEIGISCYLQNMRPRPEFTKGRKKIVFSAIIIDYGGDDEPLIDMKTIRIRSIK
ncbi:hypothetical protein LCGC14_0794180 [marine sediment metagenome]|uniref:Uncharacterized protein n=1 Tax=marine sediment metagenome TaxID=412755 RepID=A0A0F9SBL0_9ZZZZ